MIVHLNHSACIVRSDSPLSLSAGHRGPHWWPGSFPVVTFPTSDHVPDRQTFSITLYDLARDLKSEKFLAISADFFGATTRTSGEKRKTPFEVIPDFKLGSRKFSNEKFKAKNCRSPAGFGGSKEWYNEKLANVKKPLFFSLRSKIPSNRRGQKDFICRELNPCNIVWDLVNQTRKNTPVIKCTDSPVEFNSFLMDEVNRIVGPLLPDDVQHLRLE
ncbi:hypothetical protein J6590_036747 [Homalodisca vitripennis]|nr:hypothetical protein J6590_036747 [Homalodisca vitripennis]